MHLKHTRFTYCTCTCISFTKHKGRIQKLKALDSRHIDIFSKNELDNISTVWLIVYIKIQLEEQLQIKYYMINHLTLLVIKNMMDIREDSFQWFIRVLMKNLLYVLIQLR